MVSSSESRDWKSEVAKLKEIAGEDAIGLGINTPNPLKLEFDKDRGLSFLAKRFYKQYTNLSDAAALRAAVHLSALFLEQQKVSDIRLQPGDTLEIQGNRAELSRNNGRNLYAIFFGDKPTLEPKPTLGPKQDLALGLDEQDVRFVTRVYKLPDKQGKVSLSMLAKQAYEGAKSGGDPKASERAKMLFARFAVQLSGAEINRIEHEGLNEGAELILSADAAILNYLGLDGNPKTVTVSLKNDVMREVKMAAVKVATVSKASRESLKKDIEKVQQSPKALFESRPLLKILHKCFEDESLLNFREASWPDFFVEAYEFDFKGKPYCISAQLVEKIPGTAISRPLSSPRFKLTERIVNSVTFVDWTSDFDQIKKKIV